MPQSAGQIMEICFLSLPRCIFIWICQQLKLPASTFLLLWTLSQSLPSRPARWRPVVRTKPHHRGRSRTSKAWKRAARAELIGEASGSQAEPLTACNSRGLGLGGGRAEVHRFSDQTRKLGQERRSLSPNVAGSFWTPQLSHLTDNH